MSFSSAGCAPGSPSVHVAAPDVPCCGQPANGYVWVWQLRQAGKEIRQFGAQHDAERQRDKDGHGVVIRVRVKAS